MVPGLLMGGGGGTSILEGKCWKLNKKEQNKQLLTSWLRGSETLNKLEVGRPVPMSFPPLPPNALLQYTLCCRPESIGSSLIFGSTLTGAKRISNTIYHLSSPHSPPPPSTYSEKSYERIRNWCPSHSTQLLTLPFSANGAHSGGPRPPQIL